MCCGNNRAAARVAALAQQPSRVRSSSTPAAPVVPAIIYEYLGAGGATVTGPITGQPYRFSRMGDRVRVDPRDRSALAALPTLRRVY